MDLLKITRFFKLAQSSEKTKGETLAGRRLKTKEFSKKKLLLTSAHQTAYGTEIIHITFTIVFWFEFVKSGSSFRMRNFKDTKGISCSKVWPTNKFMIHKILRDRFLSLLSTTGHEVEPRQTHLQYILSHVYVLIHPRLFSQQCDKIKKN